MCVLNVCTCARLLVLVRRILCLKWAFVGQNLEAQPREEMHHSRNAENGGLSGFGACNGGLGGLGEKPTEDSILAQKGGG